MNNDLTTEYLEAIRRAEYRAEKKQSLAAERKAAKVQARKDSLVNRRRK